MMTTLMMVRLRIIPVFDALLILMLLMMMMISALALCPSVDSSDHGPYALDERAYMTTCSVQVQTKFIGLMTLCNLSMQTVELREEWTLVLVRGTFVYHVYFFDLHQIRYGIYSNTFI